MGIDVRLNNKLICSHCGNDCDGSISAYDSLFCCNGCKVVYGLLNEKGFCDYYKFNDRPGLTIRSNISQSKYDYLDQEDIKQKLTLFKNNEQSHVRLYLPQMHCSSCIYSLENFHILNNYLALIHKYSAKGYSLNY